MPTMWLQELVPVIGGRGLEAEQSVQPTFAGVVNSQYGQLEADECLQPEIRRRHIGFQDTVSPVADAFGAPEGLSGWVVVADQTPSLVQAAIDRIGEIPDTEMPTA